MDARPLQKTNRFVTHGMSMDERIKEFKDFLYDYGPTTLYDLACAFKLGQSRTLDVLNLMKESGIVTRFRKGILTYWVLMEDYNDQE